MKITLTPEALNLLSENEVLPQKIDTLIKLLYGAKNEKIEPAQLQPLIEGLDPGKLDSPSGDDTKEAERDAEKKLKAKRPKVKTTAASKAGTAMKSSKKPSSPASTCTPRATP
ncbi:MAG: hypothetical protein ACJAXZ_001411 [Akkermansiaceae bacterium]|jgi:hypothetical protein